MQYYRPFIIPFFIRISAPCTFLFGSALIGNASELVLGNMVDGSLELHITTSDDAIRTEVQSSNDLAQWITIQSILGRNVIDEIPVSMEAERRFFRLVTHVSPGDLGDVWCIGDSWTQCFRNFTWRRKLSQDLESERWEFDFVGTLVTPPSCEPGQTFDRDHNGISGITALEVLNERLAAWLPVVAPDTVLLLLGGNDFLRGATVSTTMTRLSAIIDQIRADNPDVIFYMGMYGYVGIRSDEDIDSLAEGMEAMATSKTTQESPIYCVDHRIGWDKAIHIIPGENLHPTEAGMHQLADNWLAAIKTHQATSVLAKR